MSNTPLFPLLWVPVDSLPFARHLSLCYHHRRDLRSPGRPTISLIPQLVLPRPLRTSCRSFHRPHPLSHAHHTSPRHLRLVGPPFLRPLGRITHHLTHHLTHPSLLQWAQSLPPLHHFASLSSQITVSSSHVTSIDVSSNLFRCPNAEKSSSKPIRRTRHHHPTWEQEMQRTREYTGHCRY